MPWWWGGGLAEDGFFLSETLLPSPLCRLFRWTWHDVRSLVELLQIAEHVELLLVRLVVVNFAVEPSYWPSLRHSQISWGGEGKEGWEGRDRGASSHGKTENRILAEERGFSFVNQVYGIEIIFLMLIFLCNRCDSNDDYNNESDTLVRRNSRDRLRSISKLKPFNLLMSSVFVNRIHVYICYYVRAISGQDCTELNSRSTLLNFTGLGTSRIPLLYTILFRFIIVPKGVVALSRPRSIYLKVPLLLHQLHDSIQNMAFHGLLRWEMIMLPIPSTSPMHFKSWYNAPFEFGSESVTFPKPHWHARAYPQEESRCSSIVWPCHTPPNSSAGNPLNRGGIPSQKPV